MRGFGLANVNGLSIVHKRLRGHARLALALSRCAGQYRMLDRRRRFRADARDDSASSRATGPREDPSTAAPSHWYTVVIDSRHSLPCQTLTPSLTRPVFSRHPLSIAVFALCLLLTQTASCAYANLDALCTTHDVVQRLRWQYGKSYRRLHPPWTR